MQLALKDLLMHMSQDLLMHMPQLMRLNHNRTTSMIEGPPRMPLPTSLIPDPVNSPVKPTHSPP